MSNQNRTRSARPPSAKNPPTPRLRRPGWLFFGSPDSDWKAALIHTLLGNCKRLGIDFHAYLKDVLERLPAMTNHQVHQLLPENWLKEKREKIRLAS